MSIPIENDLQIWILVLSGISIAVSTLAVILRLVAKFMRNKFDSSDYCIIAALVMNLALNAEPIWLVHHGALGFDIVTVSERWGPEFAMGLYRGVTILAFIWTVTVCLSKVSVLLMYTYIIPNPSMLLLCRLVGALLVAWTISGLMAASMICRPFHHNWDLSIDGVCGSQNKFYFAMGMVNLIIDTGLIALPMPYLYRLRMPWRRKFVAMALLGIGITTWAITLTRACIFSLLLTGLETAVAIVVACIPLMRPLFSRWSRSGNDSSRKDGRWGNGGRGDRRASIPELLFPPTWFDRRDNGPHAQQEVIKAEQVASVQSCSESGSDHEASIQKH
ncbi:integral membrane protein [Stemphylium lycopersici]|uniref:Integral membrane protein n=1 Tax=Stemphylium lycopersici TaxID=183478 RepID=A0A364NBT1_STELY|nr:integral membrane protein [Stemphylium lycopersici]